MKEVQLEHPTPINQLSKQIHIRPSIVAALENSHLGKQHKSSNCISPPRTHSPMCVCIYDGVCADWLWLHMAQNLGCYDCDGDGKIVQSLVGGESEWKAESRRRRIAERVESNESGREAVSSKGGEN